MKRNFRGMSRRRGRTGPLIDALECRALLAHFIPNSFADEIDLNPGDGVVDTTSGNITLRAAIMEANALGGADTITLGAGTYELGIAGGLEDVGLTGDLDITSDLTIQGAGAGTTIVDANGIDRVFHVRAGADVGISGLTITGGVAQGDPSSLLGWSGGGIVNNGELVLTDCVVTGNAATEPADKSGDGGGISNGEGKLTLLRTTLSNNTCEDTGGGLRSHGSSATVSIIDSTLSGNTSFTAAGISNTGGSKLTVTNSTISNNTAISGGGGLRSEDAGSEASITSSVISGNSALGGGGLYNIGGSVISVTDSSITGNTVTGFGGNGGGGGYNTGGPLTLLRVTVSNNQALNAAGGGIRSNGTVASTTITASTISGNSSTNGGGLANAGGSELIVINSTVSGNQSINTGGVFNGPAGNDVSILNSTLTNNTRNYTTTPAPGDVDNGGGSFTIQNSIVTSVGTSAGATVLNSLGNNIFTSTTLTSGFHATDQLGVNPLLGALANNGGPTQTHALLPGSPALNSANTSAAPSTDQRGSPRPVGAQADIGAYEFDDVSPSVVTATFEYLTGHAFSMQFNESVGGSLQTSDLTVRPILPGGSLGTPIAVSAVSYDALTSTALFTLPLLPDSNYRVTLNSTDITDSAGNPLNQNFAMDIFVLNGDATRDRRVDVRDLYSLALNWFGTGKNFSQGDFNYDGMVDFHDLTILAQQWQVKLDAPPPPAATLAAQPVVGRTPTRIPLRPVQQVGLTA